MPLNDRERFSVLLVENDAEAVHLLQKGLRESRDLTFHVEFASGVSEAMLKLKASHFDLLLVDSNVEEDKGLQFLKEVQKMKLKLPFLLMTPVRDDNFAREAIKAGVSDLVIKSESHFQELAQKIKSSYEKFHETPKGLDEFRAKLEEKIEDKEKPKNSVKDDLTGLYNHSYLHDRVVREFSSAARYGYALSCVMIDIDHFRSINEKFGYRSGEEILKQCGQMLFDNCRLSDCIARFGGEEFAIVLPHINYDGALELAQRLRLLFAKHMFIVDGQEIRLTLSIGVASFPDDPMKSRGDLLIFADQALSRAKTLGRNTVSLFKDMEPLLGDAFPTMKISEDKILDFQRRMSEISLSARKSYTETSKALITALENKDKHTVGHASSTARYSFYVAEAMGLPTDECEMVQCGGLLHDIGKICIPDAILLKPGRLTLTEYETMKQHPYLGYKMLKPIKFLQQEAIMVLHHHEWFNGEGYPCRLKGNEIPIGARIISVVDSYDTMRLAGGRYKKTISLDDTINELISCSGTQFDPEVVRVFIEVLKSRGDLKDTSRINLERLEHCLETHRVKS